MGKVIFKASVTKMNIPDITEKKKLDTKILMNDLASFSSLIFLNVYLTDQPVSHSEFLKQWQILLRASF